MMRNKQINLAVQVLPFGGKKHAYEIVDEAIKQIRNSGLIYKVCPFETVIEGSYAEVMNVVEKVQKACYDAGAENLICNIKIQSHSKKNVTIDDKMHKYE
ncbi:MAG: thiamine-binding protein [Bacteroidales bacterium]|nr:thiamine-binding protein [Bacteroidales bacterium]